MELGGDEKRIRALFSELSLEDQIAVPRFEKLWQRAASTSRERPRLFSTSVVVIATVIILTVLSVAVWLRYRSVESVAPQNALNVTPQEIPSPVAPPENVAAVPARPRYHPHRSKKLTSRPERSVMIEAALLSSWQSPTEKFLESPAGSIFNSLPQLNQSAEDLKSFLPKNNER